MVLPPTFGTFDAYKDIQLYPSASDG